MSDCPDYDVHAEFYDHVVPYATRPDVAFFVDLARQADGAVLEVGCGTGRVLVPCAAVSREIVGLDSSAAMLARCEARVASAPEDVRRRVTLVEGDMRTFDLGRTFALVMLPFRSFQHLLTPGDQRVALARMRAHLQPGGRLVLDLFNPSLPMLADERLLRVPFPEPSFTMPDGRVVRRTSRIVERDWVNQTQTVELSHEVTWPDGRVETSAGTMTLRYLFRYEVEYLVECSGLRVDAVYGDYDRSPFGRNYPGELIVVARASGG